MKYFCSSNSWKEVSWPLFFFVALAISLAFEVKASACPTNVVNKPDSSLIYERVVKYRSFRGLQGISSYQSNGVASLAVSGGYSDTNAYIFDHQLNLQKRADISTPELPGELMSGVTDFNDQLLWAPYRTRALYITDLELKNRKEIPVDTQWMVGIDYDDKQDVLFLIDREKNSLAVLIYRDEAFHKVKNFSLNSLGGNDFYDVDVQDNCIFLVQREEGEVWAADVANVIAESYEFNPSLLFDGVARPQHAIVHEGKYILLDSKMAGLHVLEMATGELSFSKFPVDFPMRGLAAIENRLITSGFTRFDDGTLSESEMALFVFSAN